MDRIKVRKSKYRVIFSAKLTAACRSFTISDYPSAKMIRSALISSLTKNNSQILKTVGVSAVQQQQKREQKTMPVVEREQPEKLPVSAFGWWVELRFQIIPINFVWIISGSNRTGQIGLSLVSTMSWIGVAKAQSGRWLSVSRAAP